METEVLWDTGAQVSIIPERLVREKFPNMSVKDIHELLGIGADLKLQAASGMQIPYNGWVGINFRLLDKETSEISYNAICIVVIFLLQSYYIVFH